MPNVIVATSKPVSRQRRVSQGKNRRKRPRKRTTKRRFRSEQRGGFSLRWQQKGRQWALPPLGKVQLTSLSLVVAVLLALVLIGTSDLFYLYPERVRVEGEHFTRPEEVYRAAQIDGLHVFFVKPSIVERRLLALPYIREAHVGVSFPTGLHIRVVERTPVLRWERGEEVFWVDESGVVMPAQETSLPLMVVVDPNGAATMADVSESGEIRFAPYLLATLREVKRILPGVNKVYYDTAGGLRLVLQAPSGDIQVNLGALTGLDRRISRLPDVLEKMQAEGRHYRVIDLSDPDQVFVSS